MRRVRRSAAIALGVGLLLGSGAAAAGERIPPQRCSYDTYTWNVKLKRAVARRRVSHSYYDALTPEEVDPVTGCTVCREDQTRIALPSLPSFELCHKLAPRVRAALRHLLDRGVPIYEVAGYRVGKTRGDADAHGNRTRFSNHAFGIALDVNPAHNGLYDRCPVFGPGCRLIRGGRWRPGEARASLAPDGRIVRALKAAGLRWGGEIAGRQKDFMHFSPSGY